MKKLLARPSFIIGLSVLTALFLSACNTTSTVSPIAAAQATRIAEYQTDYAALPPATQKQLTDGLISKGQNLKLVYLALGQPDRILITPDGKAITWTYLNYVSPVAVTNKVVLGNKSYGPAGGSSPLHETMDAWNNNLLKHEIRDPGDPLSGDGRIVAKASTQSWSDYGKYRLKYSMAGTKEARKSIELNQREAYQEALTIPPIASPDPIKLDVLFVDQQVTDAIVDDSFSAFSLSPLNLTATVAPGIQTQVVPD